jgi:hypothetical protein
MRPTVGRIVNYHSEFDGTVQAAIIAHVWSDNCVNLSVLDLNGIPRGVTSVVQGTDKRQWEWPDYYTKTLCSAKQEEPVCERMLDISEEKGAKANISDLKTMGIQIHSYYFVKLLRINRDL